MSEWIKNMGVAPVVKLGASIDLKFADGGTFENTTFGGWRWDIIGSSGDITEWRLSGEAVVETDKTNPKQIHGQSSLPLSLFSPLGTAYGCLGKLNGKLKYGENNYVATPVIASIYVNAIRRHLDKWMSGQEFDDSDGVPHFAAILANVDILLCARAAGTLIDDRPMNINYLEEIEKLTPIVKALHELHKDKNPKHYTIANNK